jgi:hypothetical protein
MATVGAPVDLGTAVQAPNFSSEDEIRAALSPTPPLRYPPQGPIPSAPLRYPPRGPIPSAPPRYPPPGPVFPAEEELQSSSQLTPVPTPPPPPGPVFPAEEELQSSSELIPQAITADGFADQSGYAMKYDIFQLYKPYLSTLSQPKQSVPELPQKKEKPEETKEENTPADRFDHIKDVDFLKEVKKVKETVSNKPGAGDNKRIIEKAAKDFWNSHLGQKINYGELSKFLTAAVSN